MRRYVYHAAMAAAITATTAACTATSGGSTDTLGGAEGGRYQVLIPDMVGPSGERVAGELRDLISDMATHTAVSTRDMRRAMDQYELTGLTEITARQLAQQVGFENVLWGTVAQGGSGLEADVTFIDVPSGDQIDIENVAGADADALAQAIYGAVSQTVEGIRQAAFCNDYLSSQQLERALETCEAAIAIVPTSTRALYGKATALLELGRPEEALATYETLLEIDPAHQDALLGAGLASSRMGDTQRAMAFYNRYLEVNPGDVRVRMTVANEIAQTGDHESAFRVLEPAIGENPDNIEFQEYLFLVATAAGQKVQQERGDAEAQPFFETAMAAYQTAFIEGDAELTATAMRQAIAVNLAMGDQATALRLAREATQQFDTIPAMWSQYATVLSDAGDHAEAARALTRVIEIDPEYEDVYIRRAMAYMEAGDRQAALADLERSAARGDRDRVATVILSMASPALSANRFQEAANLLELARDYAEGSTRNQINFYLGYSYYKQGEAIARANTQGRAGDAERALALFRRAVPLLEATNHEQAAQVLSAARQYIENQEAIIRAARR